MHQSPVSSCRNIISSFILFFIAACGPGEKKQAATKESANIESAGYLNHADSAKYVGMQTCRSCHSEIYNTFIRTGMGQSFDQAKKSKSAANFQNAFVRDDFTGLDYHAYWSNDSLYISEYRLGKNKKDTLHHRSEQVNYIIGSGQHTNSHIYRVNGYLHQMPMTYYTQKGRWDLPPGFENGVNTRFSRRIGLECMSCHNAYPEFVMGSENKFRSVPTGIDCERCHGPGSIHVNARKTGSRIDTSRYVDYSIVNPARLPLERQFDVCQRCHLQGNAVLKNGRSFFDFRPGQKLSDFISVFLPKYEGAEDEFIMASHAERLKLSPCFIRSAERAGKENALKPYKGAMTCVTCHNPHISVKETGRETFNAACLSCHSEKAGAMTASLTAAHSRIQSWKNCVQCHMPVSGSTDIPHVSVHDHFIRKPVSRSEKEKIKKFIGLYSINEPQPSALTRARAYLNEYERFSRKREYLDSAEALLRNQDKESNAQLLVNLYFSKSEPSKILKLVSELGEQRILEKLFINKSYDNSDAWACYRVGEACLQSNKASDAIRWLRQATQLAPYNLDFRSKLAGALAAAGKEAEAASEYEYILKENPKYAAAYSNLGYLKLAGGFPAEALRLYNIGLSLDPDHIPLLMNFAGYYLYSGDKVSAKKYLDRVLKLEPANQRAKAVIKQLAAK